MKYISTRDDKATESSLEEALCSGYAPDGGLFVPSETKGLLIQGEQWKELSTLSYKELVFEVLKPFVTPEISLDDWQSIVDYAFPTESFDAKDIIPVVVKNAKNNNNNKKIFIAELFHGPTFCFKDFGLRVVIGMLAHFAASKKQRNQQQQIALVVATTGDTGPAAVQAVQDLPQATKQNLGIVVHFPKGQISDFQQQQLTTTSTANDDDDSSKIKIVAFEGGGDDMDVPIKNIMKSSSSSSSDDSKKNVLICGINSYNIGRPLVQMVHFIWIYFKVVQQLGIEPGDDDFVLDICLPTGAMGNLAGAYMAKTILGLPLGKLTAAVNVNDFTNRMFSTGCITPTTTDMKKTLSEAINIQLPYNLERILFYMTNQNHTLIKGWYSQLEKAKTKATTSDTSDTKIVGVEIGTAWLHRLQTEFQSARVTDEELCHTIRQAHDHWKYWADPHTGVALCAAQKLGYFSIGNGDDDKATEDEGNDNPSPTIAIIATASPCKFQEAMTTALGDVRWKEYVDTLFPKRGLETMHKPETSPPILYKFDETKTLEENQQVWERRTRKIISEL